MELTPKLRHTLYALALRMHRMVDYSVDYLEYRKQFTRFDEQQIATHLSGITERIIHVSGIALEKRNRKRRPYLKRIRELKALNEYIRNYRS